MDYKAKAVAGLLAATCAFSVIALVLSVVNVKDVFLPPSTKVGPREERSRPLSPGCPLDRISPGFRQSLLCVTEVGTHSRTGWRAGRDWQRRVTLRGAPAHTAFSSQAVASSRSL